VDESAASVRKIETAETRRETAHTGNKEEKKDEI
jgi:hypothetical protein